MGSFDKMLKSFVTHTARSEAVSLVSSPAVSQDYLQRCVRARVRQREKESVNERNSERGDSTGIPSMVCARVLPLCVREMEGVFV